MEKQSNKGNLPEPREIRDDGDTQPRTTAKAVEDWFDGHEPDIFDDEDKRLGGFKED